MLLLDGVSLAVTEAYIRTSGCVGLSTCRALIFVILVLFLLGYYFFFVFLSINLLRNQIPKIHTGNTRR